MRNFVMLPLLLCLVVGCQSITFIERDEVTIQSLKDVRSDYRLDVARTGGIDEDRELTDADFPIGNLTWAEYTGTLSEFDAIIKREEAKTTLEALESGE